MKSHDDHGLNKFINPLESGKLQWFFKLFFGDKADGIGYQ
jgi:hypothetical protein